MSHRTQLPGKAAQAPSFTPAPTGLVQRKCACGGAAGLDGGCAACNHKRLVGDKPPLVQPKLKVSEPGDRYEREADRIADQIMRMPAPPIQRQPVPEEKEEDEMLQMKPLSAQITPLVQREALPEEDEDEEIEALQAKGPVTPAMPPAVEAGIQDVRQGGGQPLDPAMRALMEPRFGHDFSQVRVHSGSHAAAAVQSVSARAFTVGGNIIFGAGQYAPGTQAGQRLLAHELTHVLQQRNLGDTQIHRAIFDSEPIVPEYRPNTRGFLKYLLSIPETDAKIIIFAIKDSVLLYGLLEVLSEYPSISSEEEHLRSIGNTLRSQIADVGDRKHDEITSSTVLLSELLSTIEAAEFEKITENDLEKLRTNQLEIVLEKTMSVASAETEQGRQALNFFRYSLYPHINRRAGIETRFPPEISDEIREAYAQESGGRRCLIVVHKGLRVLMPKEIVSNAAKQTTREGTRIRKSRREGGETRKGNITQGTITLSRFMDKLQHQGRASPATVIKYQYKTKHWEPNPQEHILKLSQTDEPGWFFFAVSMHSYHTGILAVDQTEIQTPRIYWLDQFAGKEGEGFDREITGKIETVFKEFSPTFGFAPTKIWQILNPPGSTESEYIIDDSE